MLACVGKNPNTGADRLMPPLWIDDICPTEPDICVAPAFTEYNYARGSKSLLWAIRASRLTPRNISALSVEGF